MAVCKGVCWKPGIAVPGPVSHHFTPFHTDISRDTKPAFLSCGCSGCVSIEKQRWNKENKTNSTFQRLRSESQHVSSHRWPHFDKLSEDVFGCFLFLQDGDVCLTEPTLRGCFPLQPCKEPDVDPADRCRYDISD